MEKTGQAQRPTPTFKNQTEPSWPVGLLHRKVMEGKLAKVLSWYDNEWGYSCRVGDLAAFMAERQ